MSNFVYVGGQKGGTTKTGTAHLLCLGAILHKQPAFYVLTDPNRKLKSEGRPYAVLDGTDPQGLAQIIGNNHAAQNGWLVIDGGGNRPEFDKAMAQHAQLTLLPFRNSQEDVDSILLDLAAMPEAMAWPSAWPTNEYAREAAQKFIDEVTQSYPGRLVSPPISFVNSANDLLGKTLDSPSTPIRAAARRAFETMSELYDVRK